MFQIKPRGRFGRTALLAGVALGASLMASAALAGECPADQMKPDAREPVDVGHEGVTDTVIAMIDVDEQQGIKDRKFRMRKLTIEPGATVPWHSHGERPAIIYIVEGQIEEYASNCAVPIVHKAGEVVAETKEVSHWWKNTGDKTVVLLSADLLKDPTDKNM
jgi:quercetin dioxygenase-like cupin family protein